MKPASRAGFSLLEVLMATSILLGSVIVLNQLAEIGRRNAADAQDLSTAQLLCETKLNEILSGIAPMEAVDEEPIAVAPGWILTVVVDTLDRKTEAHSTTTAAREANGLAALRVTVAREAAEGRKNAAFTLVRWVPDPNEGRSQKTAATRNRAAGASPEVAGSL